MSIQQSILKFIYPFLLFINKLFPSKEATLVNVNHAIPKIPIYSIQALTNNNQLVSLEKFRGKKLLIVNTASNCGYTAQYEQLESLYKQYKDKVEIVAFPANDFQGQEPKGDEAIGSFCKLNYGVTFPLMKKSIVKKQSGQNDVFQWLTDPSKNGWCTKAPSWNFCKYLINEKGELTHFFYQGISPLDKRVIAAINE